MLSDTIELLRRFTPEIVLLLERRYQILRTISNNQPIGRRMLAEQLGLGERIVRGELEFFKSLQLLVSDSSGVYLTPECENLMAALGLLVHQVRGLASLEILLADRLGLDRVYIVPGDVDLERDALRELGRLAGRFIRDMVCDDWVVAVTGGTTMAEVANHVPKAAGKHRILVVPARGGLGEEVEIQANTIAAGIARGLGASYRLLHIPDGISEEALENLLLDHKVQEVIGLSKQADLLIHGIGVPRIMAQRRDLDWHELVRQSGQVPVGEAFGNYFAGDGQVLYVTPTIGPKLEELARLKMVAAVAGGHSKAEAIMAVVKGGFINILITDQGAAEVMGKLLERNDNNK